MNPDQLSTSQGTADKMAQVGERIGDQINLSGASIKMMLELNERYSDVTFRILVVRSAKNDTLTLFLTFF